MAQEFMEEKVAYRNHITLLSCDEECDMVSRLRKTHRPKLAFYRSCVRPWACGKTIRIRAAGNATVIVPTVPPIMDTATGDGAMAITITTAASLVAIKAAEGWIHIIRIICIENAYIILTDSMIGEVSYMACHAFYGVYEIDYSIVAF